MLKRMRGVLAALLCVVLLMTGVSSLALTSNEKENMYNLVLAQLENYLEEVEHDDFTELDLILDQLDELGNYSYSQPLRFYVSALRKVEKNEFDFELDIYLDGLMTYTRFADYLSSNDSPLFTIEEFKAYIDGRKAELEGRVNEAVAAYRACNGFYDSVLRKQTLGMGMMGDLYDAGWELLTSGDLEGAYSYFAQTAGYKDSDTYMSIIVNRLGYTPEVKEMDAVAAAPAQEEDNTSTADTEAQRAAEEAARQAEEEAARLAAEEEAKREAEAEAERLAAEEAMKNAQSYTIYITSASCNVRKAPNSNAEKVGTATVDQSFTAYEIVEESATDKWYRIAYNGGEAYVSTKMAGTSKHSHNNVTESGKAATCTAEGKT